jgi:hypothetical protein
MFFKLKYSIYCKTNENSQLELNSIHNISIVYNESDEIDNYWFYYDYDKRKLTECFLNKMDNNIFSSYTTYYIDGDKLEIPKNNWFCPPCLNNTYKYNNTLTCKVTDKDYLNDIHQKVFNYLYYDGVL